MLNSEVLAEVLADLSSTELPALEAAILQAGMLLERERRYAWADEVARHPSRWPRGVAREDPEAHRRGIREAYTSLLWPELLDGQLTPDQEDALVAGLLDALERGTRRYSIITALGKSGRRNLIPRIAAVLRRAIGADALVVHQACYALRDLLVVGWGRRLGQVERAVFLDAARAIGEAVTPDRPYAPASPATGYIPDPREAAVQTLAGLAFRFIPRAEWRGFPRRRGDRPNLTLVIRAIEAALPEMVAVFGPYEGGPVPDGGDLRAPATIRGADGREAAATWSGCSFDLGGWPPRMGFLLQGVDADELVPGSVVTVDLSEQVAIAQGMVEGSLRLIESFADIRRDGLRPDRFAVLLQPPERVRVPMPPGTPLNQSAVDWFRKLDDLGKARRGRRQKGSSARS